APDLLNDAMAFAEGAELSGEVGAGRLNLGGKIVLEHEAGDGEGGRGGQGIAAERGTMVAGREDGAVLLGKNGRNRHAIAETLGQGHDIGLHFRPLVSEEGAGAAHSRLDL